MKAEKVGVLFDVVFCFDNNFIFYFYTSKLWHLLYIAGWSYFSFFLFYLQSCIAPCHIYIHFSYWFRDLTCLDLPVFWVLDRYLHSLFRCDTHPLTYQADEWGVLIPPINLPWEIRWITSPLFRYQKIQESGPHRFGFPEMERGIATIEAAVESGCVCSGVGSNVTCHRELVNFDSVFESLHVLHVITMVNVAH